MNMLDLFLNEKFGSISDKQKNALKNMQSSNKELLELVQTVLDTYKIGKITLYKENILLKNFILEIVVGFVFTLRTPGSVGPLLTAFMSLTGPTVSSVLTTMPASAVFWKSTKETANRIIAFFITIIISRFQA